MPQKQKLSLEEKVEIIRAYLGGTISKSEAACEMLHAARSAYYKWASGKLSHRAMENEQLTDKIEKIHLDNPDSC